MDNIWQTLGIEPTAEEKNIKRAYAARLKKTDAEANPAGFQQLRQAYEYAIWVARNEPSSIDHAPDASRTPTPQPFPSNDHAANQGQAITATVDVEYAQPTASTITESENARLLAEKLYVSLQEITSRDGAHRLVDEYLVSPDLQSFIAREEFEISIAERVLEGTLIDNSSFLGLIDAMQWRNDMSRLQSLNQALAFHLGRAIRGVVLTEDWHEEKRSGSRWAQILLGAYRKKRYQYGIHSAATIGCLRTALAEAQYASFHLLKVQPDERVLDWWFQNINRPRLYDTTVFTFAFIGLLVTAAISNNELKTSKDIYTLLRVIGNFGIVLLVGAALLAAWIGVQHAIITAKNFLQDKPHAHRFLQEGWLTATPIIVAGLILLDDNIAWWLATAAGLAVCAWLFFAERRITSDQRLYILFCGVISGVLLLPVFLLKNVATGMVVMLTMFYYAVVANLHIETIRDSLSNYRYQLFQYGWIPLTIIAFFIGQIDAAFSPLALALTKLLLQLALMWSMAAAGLLRVILAGFIFGALTVVPLVQKMAPDALMQKPRLGILLSLLVGMLIIKLLRLARQKMSEPKRLND